MAQEQEFRLGVRSQGVHRESVTRRNCSVMIHLYTPRYRLKEPKYFRLKKLRSWVDSQVRKQHKQQSIQKGGKRMERGNMYFF